MRQPLAIWNPARGVWEEPGTESLLCEHLALFSETWPASGMTRNGQAFALPTLVPPTEGSGCSLLPTPGAVDVDMAKRHTGGNPTLYGWSIGVE